jgi:hypothetical protein
VDGTTSHLWFMPFIFLVCLVVFFVAKYGRDRAVLGSFLSGGILLGCAVAFAAIRRPEWLVDFASRGVAGIYPDHPAWTTTTIGPDSQIFYTFMLAWDALPAVFWGLRSPPSINCATVGACSTRSPAPSARSC